MGRMSGRPPESLRRFFWDQDFDRLRWPEDWQAVASRLLAAGDDASHRWLRAALGDDRLREWIRTRRGRGLDGRRLRYWQIVLDLPAAEVDAWLADPARRVWEERVAP
jgi:hypothetical protein